MKRGKFERKSPIRRRRAKPFLLLLSIVLILGLSIGGTVAYIATNSGAVKNEFIPAQVSCEVQQSDSNFSVRNTSNISVYIRATYTVNWMDEDGNVSGTKPSYTPTINTDDWSVESDGFYYYNSKVDSGNNTSALITGFTTSESGEYSLTVEVVAEAIQAEGMGAENAQDAWSKAALGN